MNAIYQDEEVGDNSYCCQCQWHNEDVPVKAILADPMLVVMYCRYETECHLQYCIQHAFK